MMPAPVVMPATETLGFFDDLTVGQRYNLGATQISRDAALEFAQAFDPLSIHVDEDVARTSMFGGLIVSGLQSISAIQALSMRGGFLNEASIICGAGFDDLRFLRPVRPGDTLSVAAEVIELKPPRRDKGYGIARLQYWAKNQQNVLVINFVNNLVVRRNGLPRIKDLPTTCL